MWLSRCLVHLSLRASHSSFHKLSSWKSNYHNFYLFHKLVSSVGSSLASHC
uniref:Uncharacterized protein n=1 Tax=Arundo donax TaxID=35708 RepID=A0A0A9HZK0_ARUDO